MRNLEEAEARAGRRRSPRRSGRSAPSRPASPRSPPRWRTASPNRSREAVELLSQINGRVIVTGVGKSGHIGSKIAATLASTGTPAFFVHPSEANHGDLGMIARDDAIVAMSWSGETAELKGIIAYSRRFLDSADRRHRRSTTRRWRAQADVVLCLPRAAEACPHGLAPTTSTLLQLVVGDALAIALLEARGFTPDHFRTFHPGGQLGANLTQVREIMHTGDELPLVRLGTGMHEAIREISRKGFGCVGVVAARMGRSRASSPTATSGATSAATFWR